MSGAPSATYAKSNDVATSPDRADVYGVQLIGIDALPPSRAGLAVNVSLAVTSEQSNAGTAIPPSDTEPPLTA